MRATIRYPVATVLIGVIFMIAGSCVTPDPPKPLLPKIVKPLPKPIVKFHDLSGHWDAVTVSLFRSDGRSIITGSADQTIRVWDVVTRRETMRLSGHNQQVTALAISPDGKQLVSGSADRTIRIWDLENGTESKRLFGHNRTITALLLSKDQRHVIAADFGGAITIWDLKTEKQVRRLRGHRSGVSDLSLSQLGDRLVSSGDDKLLIQWNLKTGKLIKRMVGHAHPVTKVRTSASGIIASADWSGKVIFWDELTGQATRSVQLYKGLISALEVISPQVMVTGGGINGTSFDPSVDDCSIRFLDLTTGRTLGRLPGHRDQISSLFLDRNRLLSTAMDQKIGIWTLPTSVLPALSRRY